MKQQLGASNPKTFQKGHFCITVKLLANNIVLCIGNQLYIYTFCSMTVDISTNPLYFAAVGGIILGIATSLNYCLRGKVTGMSGIIFGLTTCNKKQLPEKMSIIGGMLVASGIFFAIFNYDTTSTNFTPFGPEDQIAAYTSYIGFAIAGLLVGFGTKLGNGCTSGHGLCGLPRFSIRSIVAVFTFLFTAIAISTLNSYQTLGPLTNQDLNPLISYNHNISAYVAIALGGLLPILGGFIASKNQQDRQTSIKVDQMITWVVGLLFGCGLLVSGMVRRINIISFLAMHDNWNPSLLFVLGCGVGVNLVTFNYMIRVKKESFFGNKLFNPSNSVIDWKLVTGAACFGLGWGIGGLCPGPAIAMFSCFNIQIHVVWFACMIIGQQVANLLDKYVERKKKGNENPIESNQAKKVEFRDMDSDRRMEGSPEMKIGLVTENKELS